MPITNYPRVLKSTRRREANGTGTTFVNVGFWYNGEHYSFVSEQHISREPVWRVDDSNVWDTEHENWNDLLKHFVQQAKEYITDQNVTKFVLNTYRADDGSMVKSFLVEGNSVVQMEGSYCTMALAQTMISKEAARSDNHGFVEATFQLNDRTFRVGVEPIIIQDVDSRHVSDDQMVVFQKNSPNWKKNVDDIKDRVRHMVKTMSQGRLPRQVVVNFRSITSWMVSASYTIDIVEHKIHPVQPTQQPMTGEMAFMPLPSDFIKPKEPDQVRLITAFIAKRLRDQMGTEMVSGAFGGFVPISYPLAKGEKFTPDVLSHVSEIMHPNGWFPLFSQNDTELQIAMHPLKEKRNVSE